jgi:hypothetical protein
VAVAAQAQRGVRRDAADTGRRGGGRGAREGGQGQRHRCRCRGEESRQGGDVQGSSGGRAVGRRCVEGRRRCCSRCAAINHRAHAQKRCEGVSLGSCVPVPAPLPLPAPAPAPLRVRVSVPVRPLRHAMCFFMIRGATSQKASQCPGQGRHARPQQRRRVAVDADPRRRHRLRRRRCRRSSAGRHVGVSLRLVHVATVRGVWRVSPPPPLVVGVSRCRVDRCSARRPRSGSTTA